MKAHVKNIIGGAVLGLTLLAHTGPTWAGYASNYEVYRGRQPLALQGAVQSARFSSDNRQYIGCAVSQGCLLVSYMSCFAAIKMVLSLNCWTLRSKIDCGRRP